LNNELDKNSVYTECDLAGKDLDPKNNDGNHNHDLEFRKNRDPKTNDNNKYLETTGFMGCGSVRKDIDPTNKDW